MVEQRLALARGGTEMLKHICRASSGDDLEGFVLDIGDAWVLVASLSDSIYIDGFVVFPIADVVEVEDRVDELTFVRRALTLQRMWPPARPAVRLDLDDTATMFRAIAASAPVVTLFTERVDDDVCFVGVPMNPGGASIHLREIRYDASWCPEPSEWPYADITRIEFGDRYSAIIYAVASESEPAAN
ncbi:MAG TPA: hypothetical protein VGF84_23690 [Micromonosporaceae bacterium]